MNRKKRKTSDECVLNDFQIAALSVAFKRESITIKRWAKKNSSMLKMPEAQQLINQYRDADQKITPINY